MENMQEFIHFINKITDLILSKEHFFELMEEKGIKLKFLYITIFIVDLQ